MPRSGSRRLRPAVALALASAAATCAGLLPALVAPAASAAPTEGATASATASSTAATATAAATAAAPSVLAQPMTSAPRLAPLGGVATAVWREASGAVAVATVQGSGLFATPVSLGGRTAAAPSMAQVGTGAMVVVTGGGGALYADVQSGGAWGGWSRIGGEAVGGPVVTSSPDGSTADLVVRGTDGAGWWRSYSSGAWGAWHSLGGRLVTDPAADVTASGDLHLYVVGTDRAIYTGTVVGGVFSRWSRYGGESPTAVSAAYDPGSGTDLVVARGQDNAVWFRSGTGRWQSLGGATALSPGVAVSGTTVTVIAAGTANRAYVRFDNGSWGGWTPAQPADAQVYEYCDAHNAGAPAAPTAAAFQADLVACDTQSGPLLVENDPASPWTPWATPDYSRYSKDVYVYANGSAALPSVGLPETAYAHPCGQPTTRIVANYSGGTWDTTDRWSQDWWNYLVNAGLQVQAAGFRGLDLDYLGPTYAVAGRNTAVPCSPLTGKPYTQQESMDAARQMMAYLVAHGVHAISNSVITPDLCHVSGLATCDVPGDYVLLEHPGWGDKLPSQLNATQVAQTVAAESTPNLLILDRVLSSACPAWSRYLVAVGALGGAPSEISLRCDEGLSNVDPTSTQPFRDDVRFVQTLGPAAGPVRSGCPFTRLLGLNPTHPSGEVVVNPKNCPTYTASWGSGVVRTLSGALVHRITVAAGAVEVVRFGG